MIQNIKNTFLWIQPVGVHHQQEEEHSTHHCHTQMEFVEPNIYGKIAIPVLMVLWLITISITFNRLCEIGKSKKYLIATYVSWIIFLSTFAILIFLAET